jgi:hypothetical protein
MGEQPEMKSYLVTRKIDIDADTPEEAACTALIIQRDNDPANTSTIHCAKCPPSVSSGRGPGIPLYALDEHTRLGKRAINTLAQQSPLIRACLQQYVPRRRWIAAGQHAAFYAEGSAVSRRLHWVQSRSLEVLGIEAELSTAEVRPDGIEPFIDAIRGSLDQLDAIRTHLLLTVGADPG